MPLTEPMNCYLRLALLRYLRFTIQHAMLAYCRTTRSMLYKRHREIETCPVSWDYPKIRLLPSLICLLFWGEIFHNLSHNTVREIAKVWATSIVSLLNDAKLSYVYIYLVSLKSLATSTVLECRMSHRKWRETKQQPSRARSGNKLSCCLVSLHFLCDILRRTV